MSTGAPAAHWVRGGCHHCGAEYERRVPKGTTPQRVVSHYMTRCAPCAAELLTIKWMLGTLAGVGCFFFAVWLVLLRA